MSRQRRVSPYSGRVDRIRTGAGIPRVLPPTPDSSTEQLELDDIEVLIDNEIESLVEDLVERLEDEVGPVASDARRRPPWRPRPAQLPRKRWTKNNLIRSFEDAETRLWIRPER